MSEHAEQANGYAFLTPDVMMIVLTWVTFFALFFVLYKFAWKPILTGLDNREAAIRKSVEEVQKIKDELAAMDAKRSAILAQADAKAKTIVDESRKAAQEAAKVIQQKTREEAQIIIENATREVDQQVEMAKRVLLEESTRTAVQLAEKILKENLNEDKQRKLVKEYIKEI